MPEVLTIDGFDLRGQAFGVATRTGRYSMPTKRGENLVIPGASGSRFAPNKPFEEGIGALSVWCIGALYGDVLVAENLVLDPSFEMGTSGFTALNAATVARDTTRSRNGTYSLAVTNTATGDNSATASLTLEPNKQYTASIWFWNPTANSSGVKIGVVGVDGVEVQSAVSTARASWMKVSVTFWTGSTGSATARLYGSNGPNQMTSFDDFSVVAGTQAYNFNGDSPDTASTEFAWTGTPHASTSTRTALNQLTIPDSFAGQRQAFEDNMARAMRLFTRTHRLSEIRAGQPDGSIRRALVEWKEWSEPEVMAGGTRAEWAIAYGIPGVWWEDENATTQSATAGATLPKTLDLTAFAGMTGIIDDGVLTVDGPITNPRITEAETGAYVEHIGTVSAGQQWVVDVAAATSKKAGVSVMSTTRHAGGYKLLTITNEYNLTDTPRLTLSGTAGGAATNFSLTARRKWVNG